VLLEKVSPSGYVWYITGSVAFLLVLFAIVRVQSGKHKPNNV
jgi:hypothetical protein